MYDDPFEVILPHLIEENSPATQVILGALLGGSVVIAGALCPGLLGAFRPRRKKFHAQYEKNYPTKKLQRSIYHLKKKKYITVLKKKDGTRTIAITAHGKRYIAKVAMRDLSIATPKKWDQKWRVLMFDIPTGHNLSRNVLRRKIKRLNFFQLQKSVWVYPYPCEKEILAIAHEYNIEEYIELFTATNLLHEKEVRAFYKL